mgnify:FL=1
MSIKNYIKIKNLSKSFGDVEVLKNINLEVEEGEFFSLLGPSGCGKTTLLRILAGFEYPSEGEVFFDDANVTSLPPNLRPSNMVFQNYAIFPHINVQRNIEFGLRKENLSKDEMQQRVSNALKMVQLEGYENRYSNQLSGGQRQRIALARALVKQPKVLLLDEPLGALDKKLREEMQIELRNLQKSLGITFIFVTHDQEEAMTMSDRIAVMDEGNILQVSPPKEIYHNPKNKFVSQFIGNINILDADLKSFSNENLSIEVDCFGSMQLKNYQQIIENDKINIAIRPEEITISKISDSNYDYNFQGYVKNISFYGESTYYYVLLNNSEKILMVSKNETKEPFSENDNCFVNFNSNNVKIIKD